MRLRRYLWGIIVISAVLLIPAVDLRIASTALLDVDNVKAILSGIASHTLVLPLIALALLALAVLSARRWRGGRAAKPARPKSGEPASTMPAIRMDALDREFLPAALEIFETPPSPIRVAGIWLICVFFTAGLSWAYFGWLEIYAVAQGRIQPNGR
jgi:hypothetical protein